ncbi:hypothetical protein GQ55_6G062600 [Panicum hallii var. hallii]|uniref:Uncharacterized protein n=1 Tax=Panicum hallii var. hallii TaxID=1504633 RepID=A0A2T7D4M6_9POAL|nr:hypothetical protein GQ55_6G062600 [Panicum hallii var. hallii]
MKWWWPELLRTPATAAVMKIQQDRPDVAVEVLPPGAPLMPELNLERVRVFIDAAGLVAQIPMCG